MIDGNKLLSHVGSSRGPRLRCRVQPALPGTPRNQRVGVVMGILMALDLRLLWVYPAIRLISWLLLRLGKPKSEEVLQESSSNLLLSAVLATLTTAGIQGARGGQLEQLPTHQPAAQGNTHEDGTQPTSIGASDRRRFGDRVEAPAPDRQGL